MLKFTIDKVADLDHQHARWSIARRFFILAMFLIVVRLFASLAISESLGQQIKTRS